jgi:uncharacterized Fe-S cluster protein YjdI
MAQKVIDYKKGDLTVHWEPAKCIHSEKCWRGLNEVFKPKEKPWIQVENATRKTIITQIDKCPSGALSYTQSGASEKQRTPSATEIEIASNGPYLIKSSVEIVHTDGKREARDKVTALCRCGASKNKPYCDGSHQTIGFTD